MATNGHRISPDLEIGEQRKNEPEQHAAELSEHVEVGANPIAGVQAALGNPMPMYDTTAPPRSLAKVLC